MTTPLPTLIRTPDGEAAGREAARRTADAIADALAARGVAHVALAGGTTPKRAYALLGPLVADWSAVHLWFGDERCVGPDDPDANVLMARTALDAPGAIWHRIEGERGAEAAAAAYAAELGDVVLDLAMLGLGEDAHTASLFPDNPALDLTATVVPVHDSPKPPPDRVSMSLGTLNAARAILLLTEGAGKRAPLALALGEPSRHAPSSLLDRAKLTVIADAAALGSV
jgi:6-phosphogluconolactonase